MAPHIDTTGWSLAGSDSEPDHVISPPGSSAPSIVSVDRLLPNTHKKSPGANGTPQAAESQIKCMDSQAIEPLGNRPSVCKYLGADDSFIRHPKYFFADGNITFLVRDGYDGHCGLHPIQWLHCA
jgi:hypothetical protein